MTEEALDRGFILSNLDEAPVGLARHRIWIFLTYVPDVIGFLELFDGAWIGSGFEVIATDGVDVFVCAMHCLHLALAPERPGDGRRSH